MRTQWYAFDDHKTAVDTFVFNSVQIRFYVDGRMFVSIKNGSTGGIPLPFPLPSNWCWV